MAGMAFKRIIKFAAIIDGLFVLGLAFLSYRGWITANWNTIQDQTQSFAYNASAQVLYTASKIVFCKYTPIASR